MAKTPYSKEDLFKAAEEGTLPLEFDQWDLKNKYGETVADVAAKYGNLPENLGREEGSVLHSDDDIIYLL
jgi:hypothetical protein